MSDTETEVATAPVDVSEINADIAEIANHAKDVASASGELRNLIKQKVDNRGYNKRALGMLRSIAKLSDTQLADFRRTFDLGYQEVIGSRDGQPDMFEVSDEVEPVEFDAPEAAE